MRSTLIIIYDMLLLYFMIKAAQCHQLIKRVGPDRSRLQAPIRYTSFWPLMLWIDLPNHILCESEITFQLLHILQHVL